MHAIHTAKLDIDQVEIMDDVIQSKAVGRENETDITIADLTGVAVQDLPIVVAFYQYLIINRGLSHESIN